MTDDANLKNNIKLYNRIELQKKNGISNSHVNIPANIKKSRNGKLISIFQLFLSVCVMLTWIIFLMIIISQINGNGYLNYLEIIFFVLMMIISMNFVDMTFSNFWIDVFEGGTNVIIDEEGIRDTRISCELIKFSSIKFARILSRPIAGTGGVSINIPKNKVKLRKFRIKYLFNNFFQSKNINIIIETKYLSIDSYLVSKAIMDIIVNTPKI